MAVSLLAVGIAGQFGLYNMGEVGLMLFVYWTVGAWFPDIGGFHGVGSKEAPGTPVHHSYKMALLPFPLFRVMLGELFKKTFGHFRFAHSGIAILILFLLGLSILPLFAKVSPVGFGALFHFIFPKGWFWIFLVAYVTHIFVDGLTEIGCYILYPRKRPLRFLPPQYLLRPGSSAELLTGGVLFILLFLGFFNIATIEGFVLKVVSFFGRLF